MSRQTERLNRIMFGMKQFTIMVLVIVFQRATLAGGNSTKPHFSWDTVPVYIHFGKSSGPLSDTELRFVAQTSDFVCLEKGHGRGRSGSTEKGIAFDAKRLKELNPRMKVLFYWNTFLNYPLYDACQTVAIHPEWIFRDKGGDPIYKTGTLEQYNLLNPEFRQWWAKIAGQAVTEYGCDGIFMDAANQAKRPIWMKRGWGEGNEDTLTKAVADMMRLANRQMGEDALLVYIISSYNDYESQIFANVSVLTPFCLVPSSLFSLDSHHRKTTERIPSAV